MSNILKFACKAPKCGRRFTTQEALDSHFKLRHLEINTNNNNNANDMKSIEEKKEKEKQSMENIIKQISRTKINQHEKHHLLQPIELKGLSSSTLNNIKRKSQTINTKKDINNLNNNQIVSNNNNNVKSNKSNDKKEKVKNKKNENIIKKNNKNEGKEIEEVEIPNIIEEKQKKLLNNLFNQINSLDNYLEKDCEFHKQFTLPDVPDYDKMYDSDEDNNKGKEEIKVKPKNIINETNSEKKIYEITYDMIYNNNDLDEGKYKEIKEINLCKKNLMIFKNNKKINFEKLSELNLLNISHNYLTDINDVHFFENLKELYLNNNKIEDISFCEKLPNLAILNAEYNNIITITSLNICSKLKILKLSHNKIKYLNSTLRTIKNLKNIDELSIKENPFLSELFSYREYFITNYPNIKIFDEEKINNDTKIFAEKFYKENNPLYNKNRPLSSRLDIDKSYNINKNIKFNLFEDEQDDNNNDENDEDIFNNNDILSKTQASFTDNTNKKKEDKKIKKANDINPINDSNKDYEKKEEGKKDEETKLRNIISEQNKLINELKKDLEKSSKLNQKYEEEIEKYKIELNEENDINNNLIINDEEKEIKKIKNELETWKNDYFKLLEKAMNGKNLNDKFSEDLFNNESIPELNKKEINPKNIIERPKTANIEGRIPKNFKLLYKEINNLENINNSENEEDIEEENGEEEEEKEKTEEKKEKVNINEKEGFDDEEEIPDEEIEEMLRKSYQDLKKMKQDIKFMNDTIDNNSKKINTNNNIVNMHANNIIGNKQTLKPIILKKEKNNNLLGNKVFGKQGIGNEKTGINKNKYENDKNPSLRYQDILYQLKNK